MSINDLNKFCYKLLTECGKVDVYTCFEKRTTIISLARIMWDNLGEWPVVLCAVRRDAKEEETRQFILKRLLAEYGKELEDYEPRTKK